MTLGKIGIQYSCGIPSTTQLEAIYHVSQVQ